jgi:hypothetical protein
MRTGQHMNHARTTTSLAAACCMAALWWGGASSHNAAAAAATPEAAEASAYRRPAFEKSDIVGTAWAWHQQETLYIAQTPFLIDNWLPYSSGDLHTDWEQLMNVGDHRSVFDETNHDSP